MKYLVLIYDNENTRELFQGPDGKELMAEAMAIMSELRESGELIATQGLADPSQTKTVRPGPDGVPVTSDGPFVEAKEHLGGYLMIETDDPSRALQIAQRWPNGRIGGAVELRPVMYDGGEEM